MARARNVLVVLVAMLCSAAFAAGNDRSNSISFPTSDEGNVFSSRKLLATGSKSKKKGSSLKKKGSSSKKIEEEFDDTNPISDNGAKGSEKEENGVASVEAKPQSKFQRVKAIKEKEKEMNVDGDVGDVGEPQSKFQRVKSIKETEMNVDGDVGDVGAKPQSKFQLAKAAMVKEEEAAKVEMEKMNALRQEIRLEFEAAQKKKDLQAQVDAKKDTEHQINMRRAATTLQAASIVNGIPTSLIKPFDPAKTPTTLPFHPAGTPTTLPFDPAGTPPTQPFDPTKNAQAGGVSAHAHLHGPRSERNA